MEKKREQELSVLEVLRLHREFHLPHPVPADEQAPPSDPSSCDGVGGGAGPDSRTYGGGWHP